MNSVNVNDETHRLICDMAAIDGTSNAAIVRLAVEHYRLLRVQDPAWVDRARAHWLAQRPDGALSENQSTEESA